MAPLDPELWLTALDGPSAPNRIVAIERVEYILASACRNHDCADQNVVLLYSAQRDVVYGLVWQAGTATMIGTPPPAVAAELPKLWRAAFRD